MDFEEISPADHSGFFEQQIFATYKRNIKSVEEFVILLYKNDVTTSFLLILC